MTTSGKPNVAIRVSLRCMSRHRVGVAIRQSLFQSNRLIIHIRFDANSGPRPITRQHLLSDHILNSQHTYRNLLQS